MPRSSLRVTSYLPRIPRRPRRRGQDHSSSRCPHRRECSRGGRRRSHRDRAGPSALDRGTVGLARRSVPPRRRHPGSRRRHVFIRGAADDWDDVTPVKQPGRARARSRFTIGSADGIEAWLQRELAATPARPAPPARPAARREESHARRGAAARRHAHRPPTATGSYAALETDVASRQIRGKVGDPRDGLLGEGRDASRDRPREQSAAVEHDRPRAARRR